MKAVTRQLACASAPSRGLIRRTTRLALAALLLSVAGLRPADASQPIAAPSAAASGDTLATLRPEVRLRKLHLVRPDLIQYPLAYDVIC